MDSACRYHIPSVTKHTEEPPLLRVLAIRIAIFPDPFGPPGKFVANSIIQTFHEISHYRIKYSTVLWLLELQISHSRQF